MNVGGASHRAVTYRVSETSRASASHYIASGVVAGLVAAVAAVVGLSASTSAISQAAGFAYLVSSLVSIRSFGFAYNRRRLRRLVEANAFWGCVIKLNPVDVRENLGVVVAYGPFDLLYRTWWAAFLARPDRCRIEWSAQSWLGLGDAEVTVTAIEVGVADGSPAELVLTTTGGSVRCPIVYASTPTDAELSRLGWLTE